MRFVVSVEQSVDSGPPLLLTMNMPKKYIYVMQPNALAGAPVMVAYKVDDLAHQPTEREVVQAHRSASAASPEDEKVGRGESTESFTQAIRRFTRRKLWRSGAAT